MMKYDEAKEFVMGLHELCKKHKLTFMFSSQPQKLVNNTKHLEGYHMFFTNGEKKVSLMGGDKIKFENSITLKLIKNRYKHGN